MTRIPVVPTLLVGLAVAAMIALGVWQLERREQKEAAIRQLAANISRPQIAFPDPPFGDAMLFRRATATCPRVVGQRSEGGRSADGAFGWRQIVECATGGSGARLQIQLGVSRGFDAKPGFSGGEVRGYISHAPDHRSLLAGIFDHSPTPLMLVADAPPAGLAANPAPDLSAVPNNHLAYAVQWFLFATVAAIIYALALRRRGPGQARAS